MFTLDTSAADDLAQSAIEGNSIGRVSPIDAWVGSRVRIKRTSRGISKQEFATSLNIAGNDLAAFEAGYKHIKSNLLFRVAELMGVRPDYFFRGYPANQKMP